MIAAPALVTTLHDPDGSYLALLERDAVVATLGRHPLVTVAVTAATAARVTGRLCQLGARVVPGGPTGVARRAALAAAVPAHAAYFACDLDRWLHWAACWPEELAALPARVARLGRSERTRPWYVCLGRTGRAFRSHPPAQRLPEAATNRALSLAAGHRLDAAAGAAWLSPEAAEIVLTASRETSASTDLEWAALILRRNPTRLRGLRCEGLEWETPDVHAAAIIAAGGLPAWTRTTYDTAPMWTARLQLAARSVSALQRVMGEGDRG